MDVESRLRSLVLDQGLDWQVQLVGSRLRGDATALSDWDFRIDAPDCARLAASIPALAARLDPLGALWDPLSRRAVFMIVLHGAIKVDLFPCDEQREPQPPWAPSAANLLDIDAHFWDWALWLAGKSLGHQRALVGPELQKMFDFLLGPLGVAEAPEAVSRAVECYLRARDHQEGRLGVVVPRSLGEEVTAALAAHSIS